MTRFVYDAMNRVVSRIDPLGEPESFTYDGNGNVTSTTDRKGQVTMVAHDALDRPVTVTLCRWIDGRLCLGCRPSPGRDRGLARRHHHADLGPLHDRLTSETTALGTVAYAYDAAGRRTAMSVTGQPTVGYGYDAAGRLTQVSRRPVGQRGLRRRRPPDIAGLPNGVSAEYAYDVASQLIGLTYRRGSGVLGTLTYAYDAAGNRVRAGGTWARVDLPQPVASATHDDANRVLTFGEAALTHDDNGNLTSDGARTYTWNARKRARGG